MRAYLDIETTLDQRISVAGIYRADQGTIQLIDGGINDVTLYTALAEVHALVTFNGSGFDLPVIRQRLRVNLLHDFTHSDLMYVCRKRGLRGGLKRIESMVGIARTTSGMSGFDAPRLWRRYEDEHDQHALELLLQYNQEDIINLSVIEAHLGIIEHSPTNMAVRRVFV
ncbi:MAG: ribonuclease H-like domain-containing protein [Chloroflexaceae bacterium]|nr:ribonuclease H-like domain-containing protein [Chloroflexaceae bacterium]